MPPPTITASTLGELLLDMKASFSVLTPVEETYGERIL
jgi:hypothetical protein